MRGRAVWCGVCAGVMLLCAGAVRAQDSFFDQALRGPRGVWSTGMGLSGVARATPAVGFSYNPAGFAHATRTSSTMFRAPVYSCCDPIVLHTVAIATPVPQLGGVLGVEVLDDNFGEVYFGDEAHHGLYADVRVIGVSLGYGAHFGNDVALGATFRVLKSTIGADRPEWMHGTAHHIGMSIGVQYNPDILDRRLRAGLAILEVGPAYTYIDEAQADPAPTSLRLGLDAELINNGTVSLPLTVEVSKGLIKRGHEYRASPSWEALFSDWNAVPRDMVLHLGIGFLWRPLALGNGWTFGTGVAVGNASAGPEYPTISFRNQFTASYTTSVGKDGYSVEVGVATRWHRLPIYNYSGIEPPTLPNDMFEATVSVPWAPGAATIAAAPAVALEHITLSLGAGFRSYSGWAAPAEGIVYRDALDLEGDASFALSPHSAVALTLQHTRGDVDVLFPMNETDPPVVYDTYRHRGWTVLSSYRLRPLDLFRSLFLGAGAGIVYDQHGTSNRLRMLAMRKALHPAFAMEAGVDWAAAGHIVLTPRVRWTLVPGKIEHGEPLRLGAYHALSFGVRVGWREGE